MNPVVAWLMLQEWLGKVRAHAHNHHKAYHHAHNGLHMGYLGLVTMHGPYHIAAGLLLVVIVIGYALQLEGGGE